MRARTSSPHHVPWVGESRREAEARLCPPVESTGHCIPGRKRHAIDPSDASELLLLPEDATSGRRADSVGPHLAGCELLLLLLELAGLQYSADGADDGCVRDDAAVDEGSSWPACVR